jgi:hypothetical protein
VRTSIAPTALYKLVSNKIANPRKYFLLFEDVNEKVGLLEREQNRL